MIRVKQPRGAEEVSAAQIKLERDTQRPPPHRAVVVGVPSKDMQLIEDTRYHPHKNVVKQELGGVIDFASEALLDPAKVFTKRDEAGICGSMGHAGPRDVLWGGACGGMLIRHSPCVKIETK